MKVKNIGEFGLISSLQEMIHRSEVQWGSEVPDIVLGIGDDAAAWKTNGIKELATTDTMVNGIHFRLDTISWQDLGWKVMAANMSDVAAMGGKPKYALVTLGLNPATEVENVLSLYRGMLSICEEYKCRIVGGDIVQSPNNFITVTMIGVGSGNLLTRHAAKSGDKVGVTGSLGCSAGGLKSILEGIGKDDIAIAHLKNAHTRPDPRIGEGQILIENGISTAIDISDGLADDLGKMCASSGVGGVLFIDQIPIDEHLKKMFPTEHLQLALNGGEDYELLFTGSEPAVLRALRALDTPATIIGEIVDEHPGEIIVVDSHGQPLDHLTKRGWDHFR